MATIALIAFVGAAGAVVLAAAAGARRTQEALPTFETYSSPPDVSLFAQGDYCSPTLPPLDTIRAIPEVERAELVSDLIVETGTEGKPGGVVRRVAYLTLDGRPVAAFARPMVIAGRLPDPQARDEIAVNEDLADSENLAVNDHLRVATFTCDQFGPAGRGDPIAPAGPTVDATVVGITRHPSDLAPSTSALSGRTPEHGAVFLTPEFWSSYGPDLARYGVQVAVSLRRGDRDIEAFGEHLHTVLGGALQARVDPPLGGTTKAVQRSTRLEANALLAFAAIAGVAALFLVGQAAARQIDTESVDYPTLRSLGMDRRDLVVIAACRASIIAVAGAVVAVVGAIALSPLAPIGLAGRAELSPGVDIDWPVLLAGGGAMVLIVGARAVQPMRRGVRRDGAVTQSLSVERPSKVAAAVEQAGFPPTAIAGTRMALQGGQRSDGVPTHTAIAGVAVAVAAAVAALTVGASLDDLTSHPSDYGVNWDAMVGNFADQTSFDEGARRLAANPDVVAFAGIGNDAARIDGRDAQVVELQPGRGSLWPTITRGRPPALPGEVALGATLMDELHKDIGDTVTLSGSTDQGVTFTVVGETVVDLTPRAPDVEPGRAAVLTLETARQVEPDVTVSGLAVQLTSGLPVDEALDRLDRSFPNTVTTPAPPPDLANLHRIDLLPALLALVIGVLAIGTFLHMMVVSIRRRRREFAVLKSLGYVRQQVSAIVAWQATVGALAAVLIGIPLGVAAGRWLWRFVSGDLGIPSDPSIPVWSVVAVGVATVVACNILAAAPGRAAAHIRPAAALREE